MQTMVDIIRSLVNDLSAQARHDAVQFAATELSRAELRVRGVREAMLQFRLVHNEIDPVASGTANLAIVGQLQGQRSTLTSQLAAVSGYLAADAPSVQMLRSRIRALDDEIERVQSQVSHSGNGDDPAADVIKGAVEAAQADAAHKGSATSAPDPAAMAAVVGKYQELMLDQEFAEKAYAAAEASLERARVEADRQQSYLAIFVTPNLAQEALYPRRALNILIVLILATILWAVGGLIALTVRDHMP